MKFSFSDVINRVVYIGFGVLLGVQLIEYLKPDSPEVVSYEKSNEQADIMGDERFKVFIAQVIRDEIQVQLSNYAANEASIPSSSLAEEVDDAYDIETMALTELKPQEGYEAQARQVRSFEAANRLLDNAISGNHWDADIEMQLLKHMGQLTSDQEYEIRVKYSSAINEGLIKPDMPLGLVAVE